MASWFRCRVPKAEGIDARAAAKMEGDESCWKRVGEKLEILGTGHSITKDEGPTWPSGMLREIGARGLPMLHPARGPLLPVARSSPLKPEWAPMDSTSWPSLSPGRACGEILPTSPAKARAIRFSASIPPSSGRPISK